MLEWTTVRKDKPLARHDAVQDEDLESKCCCCCCVDENANEDDDGQSCATEWSTEYCCGSAITYSYAIDISADIYCFSSHHADLVHAA